MPAKTTQYKEDLIPRIRDLIDGYPSSSILKEFLQNADDSGSTELVVTFDKRIHENLIDSEFKVASGSALLISNNSQFKEKDFENIVKISKQGKSDDACSTGRFGHGFSSSFSISDHPSFLSNGRVYWFGGMKEGVYCDDILHWEQDDFSEIEKWLATFNIQDSTKNKDELYTGTIFRLPLRKEGHESKISNEVFSFDVFLGWCEEWKKTENLLFLRNIHFLRLQEIDENGQVIVHLEIKTKNQDEIQNIKKEIQKDFDKYSLNDLCEFWRKSKKELQCFKYHHYFSIYYLNSDNIIELETERWAVVNGLFRGEEDCLIEQAINVLNITPNQRKVLPWAGVALCVDDNGKPQKRDSQLFTFLPMPIDSEYPVQIHGWFDTNSKRTEITHGGSGNDKEILIEWNKLLFEYGVGVAWGQLIDFVKNENYLNTYYSFWAKESHTKLNEYLIKGFYETIRGLDCFYTVYKDENKWCLPISNIYLFENEKYEELKEPFKEHFSIITPAPNDWIIENFKKIDINFKKIDPKYIRNYLALESKKIEFPVVLNDMPISMLSQKKWFLTILSYCAAAEENRNYTYLDNTLPFELTLDNNIRKLGRKSLISDNPNTKLLQENNKSYYLDLDLVKLLNGYKELPECWLPYNVKNVINILKSIWDNIDITKEWCKELIKFIKDASEEEREEASEEIMELEILRKDDESFTTLEKKYSVETPVMIKKEDVKNNIKFFNQIGMRTVHPDWMDIYKPLVNDYICELTSEVLFEHLLTLDNYDFFEVTETRDFLLDLLAENIEWITEYKQTSAWYTFLQISFIHTDRDNLYSFKDDQNLYLPSGFDVPINIKGLPGEYELINCFDSKQIEMFKAMGIKEQNFNNYIKEIIVPFLEKSKNENDIKEILKWLSDEWENNINKLIGEDKNKLIGLLKNAKIIPNKLETFSKKKASELYHPNFNCPRILKGNNYMPISFDDKNIQKKWVLFLECLGVSEKILSSNIVSKANEILNKNNQKDSIKLLNYISNKFEVFENMKFEEQSLLGYLSGLPWFPVEKQNDTLLKPELEYTELKKASELVLINDIKLVEGVCYALSNDVKLGKKDSEGEYTERGMAKHLKLIVKLPNDSLFENYRKLTELDFQNKQKMSEILKYANEFYKYLGRISKSNILPIPDDIKKIRINNKWIESKFVFQKGIKLSKLYTCKLLSKNNNNILDGLKLLGVKDTPSIEYLIEYLENLPTEKKLSDDELSDAKNLLLEIQIKDFDDYDDDILPLLTFKNTLVLSTELYINDLPSYKKANDKNKDFEFCQVQFENLARKLDVTSLADNVESNINKELTGENLETEHKISKTIKKKYFKEAILRLFYNGKKISEDKINQEALEKVLPQYISFVKILVVDYKINDIFLFRDSEATTFDDKNNNTLYILEQDDEEDMIESISKYICEPVHLSTTSSKHIDRILRQKMSKEEIKEFLDKKNIKSLPKKINIDDASIYDDEENFEDESKDFGFDEEYNDDKDKVDVDKKEIPPPTRPKSSSESKNINNFNSNNNRTGNTHSKKNINNSQSKINSGSRSNEKNYNEILSPNDFKPVYVGVPKTREEHSHKEEQKTKKETEIGNKGESYVMEHENKFLLSEANHLEKATTNNKGFDIWEKDSNENIVRYIEVKTLTGNWGDGGVGITGRQLEFAQREKEKWWLFVVENINTGNTQVYQFQNPVLEANTFRFDSSWKQLVYKNGTSENKKPEIGNIYKIDNNECKIIKVKEKGKFFMIQFENDNKLKKFNPSWEKI